MIVKLLRAPRLLSKCVVRNFSAVEPVVNLNERKVFAKRAETNDPATHSENDIGKFYTVSIEDNKKLFSFYEFPAQFERNIKTFNESAFMIREPALEIINSLKTLDPTKPILKFVIYGRFGEGKTMTFCHICHFAHRAGWILCYVPTSTIWMRWSKEVTFSETKPESINIPLESAQWLRNFKIQNADLISKLDLRVRDKIVWSAREITEKDAPLMELVDHGINRVKYAADVVDVLIENIKLYSTEQRCRTLVAIDGFNGFFNPKSNLKAPDKTPVPPLRVTIMQSLMKLTQADWSNGAAVLTVDTKNSYPDNREFVFPLYLLHKEGFEHLDPFIPVYVPALNPKEVNNLLDYYEEKKWLLKPQAREEIEFLSTRNPYHLTELCGPL
ncbi:unnamed protein product [Bemisia tabaci]|uniref:Small ribosomal subunit protein mS29 n=1 Tax=Bemisia tabaci TaxID=7038 RepID=A0A9P0C0A7_BEMTA|nr:unnamed protein product [Bemisia tabaci]